MSDPVECGEKLGEMLFDALFKEKEAKKTPLLIIDEHENLKAEFDKFSEAFDRLDERREQLEKECVCLKKDFWDEVKKQLMEMGKITSSDVKLHFTDGVLYKKD